MYITPTKRPSTFWQAPKCKATYQPKICTPGGPFLPSLHGFKFENSFDTIQLPGLPVIPSFTYGLCGGMASAALDYFLSNCPIPSTDKVPLSGTILWEYLFARLLNSLGLPDKAIIRKFLSWTNRPDTTTRLFDGLQELTVPEFRATITSLCAARPVVLGLIYVGPGIFNIWRNHQVLAYAYDRPDDEPKVTNIRVYDPNHPKVDDAVIRCELLGRNRVQCKETVRIKDDVIEKNVRGFFRMPYTRMIPLCLP